MSSLYDSDVWQALDPITRAELLLVLEGGKPGVITGGDWGAFQRVITHAGLSYHPTSGRHDLHLSAYVARPALVDAYVRSELMTPQRCTAQEALAGAVSFLGYPACCVATYAKHVPAASHRRGVHPFPTELATLIKETGDYPAIFDYAVPAFTPCSITCESAIQLLTSWKDVIERCDPDAADAMIAFNTQRGWRRRIRNAFWQEYNRKGESASTQWLQDWLSGEHNHYFAALRRKAAGASSPKRRA